MRIDKLDGKMMKMQTSKHNENAVEFLSYINVMILHLLVRNLFIKTYCKN